MATEEGVNRVTQLPADFMKIMSEFRLTTAMRTEVCRVEGLLYSVLIVYCSLTSLGGRRC